MEVFRKQYEELTRWKGSSKSSKALMVKGARRVGKSFLVEKFAKKAYSSCLLIDFASPLKGTLHIFKEYGNRHSLDEFFAQLSVLYGVRLQPGRSVIVFDEVQLYPKARELVKYLVADGRYDYIETGSLISIQKNVQDIIIPSEEEELLMHPLDFEEFLLAMGDDTTIPFLKECFQKEKPLGNLLKPVMEKVRLYMLVGGMPQAVAEYAGNRDVDRLEKVKRGILRLYREDIAKYAGSHAAEARAIFDAIPSQLSHHDKKIKYSALSEGDRFSSYRDALHWIADSMVGNICMGLDAPSVFDGFALQSGKLKCYMADTGLLLSHASGEGYLKSELYKSFMLGKLAVNAGMLTENLVAQMLRCSAHDLYFYEKREEAEGRKKKYELDFLIHSEEKVLPIEVKSGASREHSSLDYFSKKYRRECGKPTLLTKGDLRITEQYRFLPLPMAMFL